MYPSLPFDAVESFAVHADDSALRYERIRVNLFDQMEDDTRFALFGQDE